MKNEMTTESIRPEGYENERRDCTVRALSLVGNVPYEKVRLIFKECGRKDRKRVVAKKIIQQVCKKLNLKARQIKRSGSVHKLIELYPEGKIFCLKTGHAFSLIDGVVHGESKLNSHIKGAWIIEGEKTKCQS